MAIFSRKKKKKTQHRIRDFFWPKIGWKRTLRYYKKRVFRISDTPHGIAAGVAAGVAVSCTPFIGFHLILILVLCLLSRGNVLAGLLSSLVGNPATFPFVWMFGYLLGAVILGIPFEPAFFHEPITLSRLMDNFATFFLPMIVGCLIIAIIFWVFSYFLTEKAISKYQAAKRLRLLEKKKMFQALKSKIPLIGDKENTKKNEASSW